MSVKEPGRPLTNTLIGDTQMVLHQETFRHNVLENAEKESHVLVGAEKGDQRMQETDGLSIKRG